MFATEQLLTSVSSAVGRISGPTPAGPVLAAIGASALTVRLLTHRDGEQYAERRTSPAKSSTRSSTEKDGSKTTAARRAPTKRAPTKRAPAKRAPAKRASAARKGRAKTT